MTIYTERENSLYAKFRAKNPGLISEVSRNFKIKVYGQGYNKLVGVFGLLNILGSEMTARYIKKALKSQGDVFRVQLGRGLKVSFYSN